MVDIILNWDVHADIDSLDLYKEYLSKNGGVYLWIFNGVPRRIAYVGETKCFQIRMNDHMVNRLGSRQSSYGSPRGGDFIAYLRDNILGRALEDVRSSTFAYMPEDPTSAAFSFQSSFSPTTLRMHQEFVRSMSFAFCSIGEDEIRKNVESVLLHKLRATYISELDIKTEFKVPGGKAHDSPLGRLTRTPEVVYKLKHQGAALDKIPVEVTNIVEYRGMLTQIFSRAE